MKPGILSSAIIPSSTYDVIIPAYDRADTVERAVDSVLSQDPAPQRVIMVDDGSRDGTAEVLLSLERRHDIIESITLPRNVGASAARNAGLGRARSAWVAFLDSDDAWVPGAAAALLAGGDADVVVGHFRRAWRSGILDAPECGWDGHDIVSALAITGVVGPSWSLIRRALAVDVEGFDPSYRNCNDWDFYVRVAAAGARFARIDDTIALYHVAAANRLSLDAGQSMINADRVRAHPLIADRLESQRSATS